MLRMIVKAFAGRTESDGGLGFPMPIVKLRAVQILNRATKPTAYQGVRRV